MSFQRALAATSSGSSARIRRCANEVNSPLPMPGPFGAAFFFFFFLPVLGAPATTSVWTRVPVTRLNPQLMQRAAPGANGDEHSGQAAPAAGARRVAGCRGASATFAAVGGVVRCMILPQPHLSFLPA